MVYFGTYGFSYNDWVGNFYPISMPRREWFSYYAREFNTCEVINLLCSTWAVQCESYDRENKRRFPVF